MGGEVLVSLLVTVVLGDVVEVFSADDERTVHLGGDNGAGQDTATDGDETGEGALLVYSRTEHMSDYPYPSYKKPAANKFDISRQRSVSARKSRKAAFSKAIPKRYGF